MKKNKALRIAAALLVVVAITTCGMTGALAKYIDAFTAEGTAARAGLFKVVVDGADPDGKFQVSLTPTLYCVGSGDCDNEGDPEDPDHVQAYPGSSLPIIVPGTILKLAGSFLVRNYSEVAVTIDVDTSVPFEITPTFGAAASTALTYSADGITYGAANAVSLAACIQPTGGGGVFEVAPLGGTQSFDVEVWVKWPFTIGDGPNTTALPSNSKDTIIGKAQATAFLTGSTEIVAMVPCDCSLNTNGFGAHDAGCHYKPAVSAADTGFIDLPARTDNTIGFNFGILATQVD
ncbi:MAG: hypothetical protein FWC27_11250 [Firmicutes bacterium]|nr:hypothetical protein [Bacillota bacterium]